MEHSQDMWQPVYDEKDIDRIIELLDQKTESGVSRIKVEVSDSQQAGTVTERYHHGRCDVGSVFANGMKNIDCG